MYALTYKTNVYQVPLMIAGAPGDRPIMIEFTEEDLPVHVEYSVEGGELVIDTISLAYPTGSQPLSQAGQQGKLFDLLAEEFYDAKSDDAWDQTGLPAFDPRREYGTLNASAL